MEAQRYTNRGSRIGYAVALLGAAAFVVGCFLPFFHVDTGFGIQRYSLWSGTIREGFLGQVGRPLSLFGGVFLIAVIAILGMRGQGSGSPRTAIAAAVAVWSLSWVGHLLISAREAKEIGYWVVLLSFAVVTAGVIVVALSARAGSRYRNPAAAGDD